MMLIIFSPRGLSHSLLFFLTSNQIAVGITRRTSQHVEEEEDDNFSFSSCFRNSNNILCRNWNNFDYLFSARSIILYYATYMWVSKQRHRAKFVWLIPLFTLWRGLEANGLTSLPKIECNKICLLPTTVDAVAVDDRLTWERKEVTEFSAARH